MIWDAVRYGFSPVYWLTVEGIPVVWIEKATGKTLPSGFTTEAAVLSIDKSGAIGIEQIDRQTGAASTPPLAIELLDSTVTRDWMRKPSVQTTLAVNASAASLALSVNDSTGFTTDCYVGLEHMTIASTALGVLNLSARGVNGYAYAHTVGTGSQIVSDRPRYWRGRQVTLYAAPMDASGYVTGATLASDSVEVWRGRLSSSPSRTQNSFQFQAEAIDRILDGELPSVGTGTVEAVGSIFAADLGASIKFTIEARDATFAVLYQYAFTIYPFAGSGIVQGEKVTGAKIRDLCVSAFAAAIAAVGANVDVYGLQFLQFGEGANTFQKMLVVLRQDAAAKYVFVQATAYNINGSSKLAATAFSLANVVNAIELDGQFYESPWSFPDESGQVYYSVQVKLDDAKKTSIYPTGTVSIESTGTAYAYKDATYGAGSVFLLVTGDGALDDFQAAVKSTVKFQSQVVGTWPQTMLEVLESSGTAALRGPYDVLERGAGYALSGSLIDVNSFGIASTASSNVINTVLDGGSFYDLFGGLLGLYKLAVVQRRSPTTGAMGLSVVSTAAPGAPGTVALSDIDLLAHAGDPIESVNRVESPNSIMVTIPANGTAKEDVIIANDIPNIEAQGKRDASYTVPIEDRDSLRKEVVYLAASSFAYDQSAQAATLLVPPWIAVDVGDVVLLNNLTHPSLWTWTSSPGVPGYSGVARVVGRTFDLVKLAVKLTVLFDGGTIARSISPSAEVSAFTGPAGAVTSMSIPAKYYAHFAATRTVMGGNYYVQHYRPGQVETTTQYHLVTGEAIVGGVCVLTIGSHVGGHTIVTGSSRLTLPTRTGGRLVSYQQYFAHVDDGANWA